MSWIDNLPENEKQTMKPWLWALHKSNPNAVPLWVFWVPILFTPLTIFLFRQLNGYAHPSWAVLLRDCGFFAFASLAGGFVPLPLTPLIKSYVYGRRSTTMLPRIGVLHESFVKFLFMTFSHVLGSAITAVIFMGWTGYGWPSTPAIVWQLTWTMSLASLPSTIPGLLVVIAKIKLVSLTRVRKRRDLQQCGSEAAV